jgi:hypothetical protein
MSTGAHMYNAGQYEIGKGRVTTTGSYIVSLVTTGYTFNADHAAFSDGTTNDPQSYELAVAGYSRQTLGSVTLTQEDTLDYAYLDAADPVFTTLAGGANIGSVIIFPYSTSSTSRGTATTGDTGQTLLCCYDTTTIPTNGSNVTFTLSTQGFLKFGTTT